MKTNEETAQRACYTPTTAEHWATCSPRPCSSLWHALSGKACAIGLIVVLILVALTACNESLSEVSTTNTSNSSGQKLRVFPVNAGTQPKLELQSDGGNIHIQAGRSQGVSVQTTVHTQDSKTSPTVTYNQSSDQRVISVREHNNQKDNTSLDNNSIDFDITVPTLSALQIVTKAGDIVVDGVNGQMSLTALAGSVTTSQTTLEGQSALTSTTGDIAFTGTIKTGATCRMQTQVGSIDVNFVGPLPSLSLDVITNVGNISSDLPGISVNDGTTQITHGTPPYAALTLQTQVGSINLHQSTSKAAA